MLFEKLNEHKVATDELKLKLEAKHNEKEILKKQNYFMVAL